jgi:hypothetical protein
MVKLVETTFGMVKRQVFCPLACCVLLQNLISRIENLELLTNLKFLALGNNRIAKVCPKFVICKLQCLKG